MSDATKDRADITEVLVRYATGIDRRDWVGFRSIWTDDVDANYGRGIGHFHSADEITEFMTRSHAVMGSTWHRLSNFSIDIQDDRATARTYVHAVLNVDRDDPDRWMDVIGHYDDELVRTPEGWRIARRRCGRARVVGSRPDNMEI
ncbi:MAG: nuclear transport factor 2 family protein [Actinomycetota bacterium]|nr:nuclear transport factor 2 family protein [Actinomycetota bacterium]